MRAEHVFGVALLFNLLGHRVVAVHFLKRNVSSYAERRGFGTILEVIEVCVVVGNHNDVVSGICSGYSALFSAPRHHNGRLVEVSSFENFIPADDCLSMLVEELFGTLNNVALKLRLNAASLFLLKSEFLGAALAQRAFFPFAARAFVSADVEVFSREELNHFSQDVFDEFERGVFSGAHNYR